MRSHCLILKGGFIMKSSNGDKWSGNTKSIYSILGASSHSEEKRADSDYYATDPRALARLLKRFNAFQHKVWEPACGEGHLAKVLVEKKYQVKKSDIMVRSYPCEQIDFLNYNDEWDGDIITNPPYALATEFVLHALELLHPMNMAAFFLKIQFLETKRRYETIFKKQPPKYVFVFRDRITVAKNGDIKEFEKSSAVCYAWYIWSKGLGGPTIIDWL